MIGSLNNKKTKAPNGAKPLCAVRAYKCVHCGKTVERESLKKWIKSYCEETEKSVRLMLVGRLA